MGNGGDQGAEEAGQESQHASKRQRVSASPSSSEGEEQQNSGRQLLGEGRIDELRQQQASTPAKAASVEMDEEDSSPWPIMAARRLRSSVPRRVGTAWQDSLKRSRSLPRQAHARSKQLSEGYSDTDDQEKEVAEALFDLANMFSAEVKSEDEDYEDSKPARGASKSQHHDKPKRPRATKARQPSGGLGNGKAADHGFGDGRHGAGYGHASTSGRGDHREASSLRSHSPTGWEQRDALGAAARVSKFDTPPLGAGFQPGAHRLGGAYGGGYQAAAGYGAMPPAWPSAAAARKDGQHGAVPAALRSSYKRCASHVYIAHYIEWETQRSRYQPALDGGDRVNGGGATLPPRKVLPAQHKEANPPAALPNGAAALARHLGQLPSASHPPPHPASTAFGLHQQLASLPLALNHGSAAAAQLLQPGNGQPSALQYAQLAMLQGLPGAGFPFLPQGAPLPTFPGQPQMTPAQMAALAPLFGGQFPLGVFSPSFAQLAQASTAAAGSHQQAQQQLMGRMMEGGAGNLGAAAAAAAIKRSPSDNGCLPANGDVKLDPGMLAVAAAVAAASADPSRNAATSSADGKGERERQAMHELADWLHNGKPPAERPRISEQLPQHLLALLR